MKSLYYSGGDIRLEVYCGVKPDNTHDLEAAPKLLHGKEERVFGDAGYRGIEKRAEHQDRDVSWHIAERPGRRKTMGSYSNEAWIEEVKASMRAKVEHPFRYIKRVFGYDKVRYRGLAKNHNRLCVLTAFANLLIGEKYMLA